DSHCQGYPDIYGDIIVWVDDRNGDEDIYIYDISGTIDSRNTSDGNATNGNDPSPPLGTEDLSLIIPLGIMIAVITIGLCALLLKKHLSENTAKEISKEKIKNQKEWTKCPKCKANLKKKNLKSHIKKVHKR
ncbi:MAG: hypothetical protein ACFFDN_30165, partial [Candidatus Hodarchaeota archaeon]